MRQTNPDPVQAFLNIRKKPARRYIGASVFLSCCNGVLLIAGAWILAHIIDDVMFEKADAQTIAPLLALALLLYAARAMLSYGADRLAFLGADKVKTAVRADLLKSIVQQGPVAAKGERSGAVLNAYIDGVEALQGYYMQTLPSRMTATILPLAIFLVILPFDLMSGLVLLVTAPLIPVFMIWIGRGAERLNQQQWRRMTYMGGRFLDVLQGLTTLKLFNASRREAKTIQRLGEEFRRDTMAVLRIAFLSSLVMEFFATVSIAMIAVLIGFRLLWGEMGFADGFFILLLAPDFYQPLRKMGAHYHAKMEAIGAAEKIVTLLNANQSQSQQAAAFDAQTIAIEFRNVSFSYEDNHSVLKHANFIIRAGEKVALAGPSGSGKSTILSLILGFIQPQEGEILINGKNLSAIKPSAWWQHLAWAGQKPRLFTGSIADNVRIGRPDASASDITALLSRCGIEQLAANTLGENGSGLSGGQAQRVALARALLRNAPLLLLDEPTAHLDPDTEALIQRAISDLAGTATVIFAAHRSATLAAADRVLTVKDGRVVETGKEQTA